MDTDLEYRICRGDFPEQVLTTVILDLKLNPQHWWARGRMESGRHEQDAVVYRTGPRTLLVAGDNHLASSLRKLLAAEAAPGWGQVTLPESPRPIKVLLDKLDPSAYGQAGLRERCATLLFKAGLKSADEVAVLPEECLADIRGAGPKVVRAILNAAAGLNVARPLPVELDALLDRLGLPHLRTAAPRILAAARAHPRDPADLLIELLTAEETGRAQHAGGNGKLRLIRMMLT